MSELEQAIQRMCKAQRELERTTYLLFHRIAVINEILGVS